MDLLSRLARLGLVAMAAVALGSPQPADGQGLTQDEALRAAFPQADSVVRRTAYLDDDQLAQARSLAGSEVPVESGVVTHYLAFQAGRATGVAYFDAHRVRTFPEVLMVVVGPDARIRRVEVVRFSEPPEYLAPGGWLGQFTDRGLDPELSHKRGIANITGATLTARAATAAARRVLALHRVIAPLGPASGGEG
ncbi:MAG TPA: FMN-binding protein [Longimicrobiales bacterium]|nr:FMN-binding protein [Longimicrobiales bacterium]